MVIIILNPKNKICAPDGFNHSVHFLMKSYDNFVGGGFQGCGRVIHCGLIFPFVGIVHLCCFTLIKQSIYELRIFVQPSYYMVNNKLRFGISCRNQSKRVRSTPSARELNQMRTLLQERLLATGEWHLFMIVMRSKNLLQKLTV